MAFLLKKKAKTSTETILVLAHAYSREIGSERLLELFEASKAFDVMFLYLESIVDGSSVSEHRICPRSRDLCTTYIVIIESRNHGGSCGYKALLLGSVESLADAE